ncbi:Peptidase FtsH [Trinorchestia longiramus]|nr:Peptidase FtsH [Trinorchestia longiramus]
MNLLSKLSAGVLQRGNLTSLLQHHSPRALAKHWSAAEQIALRSFSCIGLVQRSLDRALLLPSSKPHPCATPVDQTLYIHTTSSSNNNSNSSGSKKNSTNSSSSSNNNDDDEDKRNKNMQMKAALWMLTAYIFVLLLGLLFPSPGSPEPVVRYVSWHEFVHQMLARGEVERVLVRPDVSDVVVHLHEGAVVKGRKVDQLTYHLNVVDVERFEEKLREVEQSLGLLGSKGVPVEYSRASDSAGVLITKILLGALLVALLFSLGSNMSVPFKMDGFRQMSRAKFTAIDPLLPGSGRGVRFSDVAGAKEAKQEVMEFVDFLKNPLKYRKLGAKSPKGALLLGPPGCGKTLLAKAVATEGQVPFLAMNGSEFIEMIGGLGAARVRDLFVEAKKRSPCIIYIDEIDAIGRKRSGSRGGSEGSSEGEQTLNQLLVEMDGIGSKEGVVLLASTNRLDMLDKALLRPGRFDRHIVLDLPTQEERREILEHHLKSIVLEMDPAHYSRRLAALTLGFSGAELANVVNEAALYAARNAMDKVSGKDLEYAIERVIGGIEKKSTTVSPEERRIVAYHEAGHALIGWLLEHTDALLKVTIVPRTSHALGFAQYQPKDQKLFTQEQLLERMSMALGGRVAESLMFNRVTTGAQNDLEKVTKLAYAQVRQFGFSSSVGQVSFPDSSADGDEGRFIGRRPYSDQLSSVIDREANRLIFQAYKSTEEILSKNMDKLKLLAEALLEKETLSYQAVEELWGPPPHGPKQTIDPIQFEEEVDGAWTQSGD